MISTSSRPDDYAAAWSCLEECIGTFREAGDTSFIHQTVYWLRKVALKERDAARAAASFAECLARGRRAGEQPDIGAAVALALEQSATT